MPAALNFIRVVPAQRLSSNTNVITHTIECILIYFQTESQGFVTNTWWPNWLPGNPAWLPFVRPIWHDWSYTDSKGYPRNLSYIPSLSGWNSYQHMMPKIQSDKQMVAAFRMRVNAHDTYGNHASTSYDLTLHRSIELERRPERDCNATVEQAVIEAVSGGYPGPITVTYTETTARTCQRSFTHTHSGGLSIPLAAMNVAFGFEVTASVSSTEEHVISRDAQATVDKGQVGIWYRKVQPFERHADVFEVDDLGNRNEVDKVVVLDYVFSNHLARGVDEPAAHADGRTWGQRT